jgi:hypothetical protein
MKTRQLSSFPKKEFLINVLISQGGGSHFVCGTEKTVEQARSMKVKEELIIKTSGTIVHPRFYEPIVCDRRAERQRLGLDPDCLTGLVLFGANRYNADWVEQKQVGLVVHDFRNIDKAAKKFLEPENFARYRANIAAVNNQAVFEICENLQKILADSYKTTETPSLEYR